MTELKPGDILFFKPKDMDPSNLEHFPTLAAVVQSLPYEGKATSHPWHHVAIVTKGAPDLWVVEFAQAAGGVVGWEGVLVEHELTLEADQVCDVLRPPEGLARGITSEAQAMALAVPSITYATVGLVGFAVAVQGRVFLERDGRTEASHFAWGAETVARELDREDGEQSETCVTAALIALNRAGLCLNLTEPPPPSEDYKTFLGKYAAPLSALYRIVKASAEAATAEDVMLSDDVILDAYDPDRIMVPGPPVQLTKDYLTGLSSVIRNGFISRGRDLSVEGLKRLGADSSKDLSASWLVSPAMLYEALAGAGFTAPS